MATDLNDLNGIIKESNARFQRVRAEIAKVLVGQQELVESMLIALLTDGHLLLEGLPGLAKTLAVTTLAKVVSCDYKRVQFTPDLLPADLVGTSIYNPKDGLFTVRKGPIFTNILLADEINRAPAKVQSALLEVMQERQVTISGETFKTGVPYLVLATQNPIEQEGTYPLPEAQTDRFMMKVKLEYPSFDEERQILQSRAKLEGFPQPKAVINTDEILHARHILDEIYIDDKVTNYLLSLVFATRDHKKYGAKIDGLLQFGASPRASIALTLTSKAAAFLAGRAYVTPHDIKSVGHRVLRHRLRLSYEAEAEEVSADNIIDKIFEAVPVP